MSGEIGKSCDEAMRRERTGRKPWRTPRIDILEIEDAELSFLDLLNDRPMS